jgi:ATP-dependent DNA ligase
MLQHTFPAGFIAPCLPTKTDKLPSGDLWLHEIKHDGFRVIARKDGDRVRLYSRPGNDLTHRFRSLSRRWHACARAPASSTAKLSPATPCLQARP